MVQTMDTEIGHVLPCLQSANEDDDTSILSMSVNSTESLLLEAIPVISEYIF